MRRLAGASVHEAEPNANVQSPQRARVEGRATIWYPSQTAMPEVTHHSPDPAPREDDAAAAGSPVARVIAEHRGAYDVKTARGEFMATVTGERMFTAAGREDFPAVGDWVEIADLGHGRAVIRRILPRRTLLKRKFAAEDRAGAQIIAANIDTAFIIEAVDRDFNLNRLERYAALAKAGGIEPAVILNKTDLIDPRDLSARLEEVGRRFPGTTILSASTRIADGVQAVREQLVPGRTYCFLGSSGVGKSSLINRLLGEDVLMTGEIGVHSGRGRHVTTVRQMFFLPDGAVVIDNPGMREVGMADSSEGVAAQFSSLSDLAGRCKFADCSHTSEPGCAVLAAVDEGRMDRAQYENFLSLKKEAAFFELTESERRAKDRNFGRFVHGIKKDLKKYRP